MHPEEGLDMLICYGCGVTAHKYCYGIKTPVDQYLVSGQKISMFVCEKCQYLGPQCSKECIICHQEGGALKKISNTHYFIHVLCALFSNDYKVLNFQQMEIHKNYELDSPLACDTPKILCEYCKKPGANIRCKHSNCNKFAHLYCAWIDKANYLIKDEESTEGWRFTLRKESNYYGISHQALEKDVHKRIIKIYERLFAVATKWNKGITPLFYQGHTTDHEGSLLNKLQKTGKKPKDLKNELKDIFASLKEEMKNLVNLFPKLEDFSALTGEIVEAECHDHRIREPLCICNAPYNSSHFMFACDSCENWFHCTCLNISKKDVGKKHKFNCKRCQDWAHIRYQFFNKIEEEKPQNNHQNTSYKTTKDKNGIIPNNSRDFWIIDYVIISIMLEDKIAQIKADPINFEANYRNLLESAQFIPFKLSPLLTKLLENYCISYSIDDILLKYFPIQDNKDQYNSHPNIQVQKLTLEIECFEKIIEIYKEEGLPNTLAISNIHLLVQTKQWKRQFFQILDKSGKDLCTTSDLNNSFGIKNRECSKIQFFLTLINDNPPFNTIVEGLKQLAYELKETIMRKPTIGEIHALIKDGKNPDFCVLPEVQALESDLVKTINILKQYMKPMPNLHEIEQILVESEASLFQVQGPVVDVIERYRILMTLQLKLKYYAILFFNKNDASLQDIIQVWMISREDIAKSLKDFERYGKSLDQDSWDIKEKLMQLKTQIESNPFNKIEIEIETEIFQNQMKSSENPPFNPQENDFELLQFNQEEDSNSRNFSKFITSNQTQTVVTLDKLTLIWLNKLNKFYNAFVPDQSELELTFEQQNLSQYQLNVLVNKFSSVQNSETQNQISLHFEDFKQLIHESIAINQQEIITDISNIIKSHQKLYLDLLTMRKTQIKFSDLSILENLANKFNHKTLKLCQDVRKFITDYTNQVASGDIKGIFKKSYCEPEEKELKNSLTLLLERSKNIPMNLSDKQKNLHKLISQLKWKSEASNLLNSSPTTKKHPYKILKNLLLETKSLQIPSEAKLFKDLYLLCKQVKENRQMCKDHVLILDKIKKELSENNSPNQNIHKAKLTLNSALQVQKAYKTCTFIILSEKDITESEDAIVAYLKLKEEVLNFIQSIESLTPENVNLVLSNLKHIRSQVMSLLFKDEETEELISSAEKTLHAKILLDKQAFGSLAEIGRNPEEFERLLRALEKPTAGRSPPQDFAEKIKQQLDIHNHLKTEILNIKERQGFLNIVRESPMMDLKQIRKGLASQTHLQSLTDNLNQCAVENKDLADFIQQLNSNIDFVREACSRLDANKELQKHEILPIITDIPILINLLQELPVNLEEEETFLESYLEYLKSLEEPEPELEPEQTVVTSNEVANQTLPDQIRDDSLYTCGKSFSIMGYLEDCQTKEAMHTPTSINLETEITQSQPELIPIQAQASSPAAQAWKQKVADLQTLEKEHNGKIVIKLLFIKELLLEGYDLLYAEENVPDMIEAIKFMEFLNKETEKHVRKTSKLSRSKLSETTVIDPLWNGFVDLRDEFSQFHIAASLGIEYRSLVRNFAGKNEREILSIIKKEKGFLSKDRVPRTIVVAEKPTSLLLKTSSIHKLPLDDDLEKELKSKVFIDDERVAKPKSLVNANEDDGNQHQISSPSASFEGEDDLVNPEVKLIKERKNKELRNETKRELAKILAPRLRASHSKAETKKTVVTNLESRLYDLSNKSKEEYHTKREDLYNFLKVAYHQTSDQDIQPSTIWSLFNNSLLRRNLQISKELETNESSPEPSEIPKAQDFMSAQDFKQDDEIPSQNSNFLPITNNNNTLIEDPQDVQDEESQSNVENNLDQSEKGFYDQKNTYLNSNSQTQDHTQFAYSPHSSLSTPNQFVSAKNSVHTSFINSPSCHQGLLMNGTPSNSHYDENSQSVSSQDKIYQFLSSLSAEEKAKAMQYLSNQPTQQYLMQPTTYQNPIAFIPKTQIQMNQPPSWDLASKMNLDSNSNPFAFNLNPPTQQFSQINHPLAFNKNYITYLDLRFYKFLIEI